MHPPDAKEITPEHLYLSRRAFMRAAALAAGSGVIAACGRGGADAAARGIAPPGTGGGADPASGASGGRGPDLRPGVVEHDSDEQGESLTAFDDVIHYNNFYEFSTNKQAVAPLAASFVAKPWSVEVVGMCRRPRAFNLDDLAAFGIEERVYRLRCVEGWSMVIPWRGFPLARLLEAVEPLPEAAFVRFEALNDPARMPGQGNTWYDWPYAEGLRMDEAIHDLTLLATGLYGTDLPPQNGAPVRLVVPWKYGFKSIKSIVRIELQSMQPATLWSTVAPSEYGFYANVNPEVDHPRWSQASERRIGEFRRRRTMMFNGYGEQVAHLYEGMDLRANF